MVKTRVRMEDVVVPPVVFVRDFFARAECGCVLRSEMCGCFAS
jgi:hypothetical protein